MEITNPLVSSEKSGRSTAYLRVGLVLGIVVIVVGAAVVAIQVATGKRTLRSLLPKKLGGTVQQSKVELQQEYQNPFNQETQFINPFEKTKNPFRNL